MDRLEVSTVLEECLQQLAGKQKPTLDKETFKSARGLLSAELTTLLQEAVDMQWPFVEEKWQYKRSIALEDKVNTMDLIKQHLPQLMTFLKASISAAEPVWAMSVVFLVDRFLYWIDSSHTLLKIAKALHKRYPETPVAPQIIIRQARIYLNTGKLQKAEYILSSLINNSGTTGCWRYNRDSDRILVQAVSVQVRGQVLQKLGLWLEAAELIWASLIGFYVLPLPDKKGIGTSLGLLASVLVSMNDQDFTMFNRRPYINLGFLGDDRHRLLCAAQAAKLAVVYSQFGSLYVLTHMVTRGTCLLSYSFSKDCPTADKLIYLALAKEAFENGLQTKAETDIVTSQQELHTLIKAAYCLAITNKWMFGLTEEVTTAIQACQEANVLLYSYCFKDKSDKVLISSEVMTKIHCVKSLLKVTAFTNSDPHSYIPDSYRAMEDRPVPFTLYDFTELMKSFQKHHKSACEAYIVSEKRCKGDGQSALHANCITAFQTTLTESLATQCTSLETSENDNCKLGNANEDILGSDKSQVSLDYCLVQKEMLDATNHSEEHQPHLNSGRVSKLDLKSNKVQSTSNSQGRSSLASWSSVPNSGASFIVVDPSCCTEADDAVADGVYDEKINPESQSEPVQNNEDKCKAVNTSNASNQICTNYQTSILSSLQPARSLDKGGNTQCQSKQELFTTLESEDNVQITNKMDGDGTEKGSDTKISSGSYSSSLGSSWQSVAFSKSPPNGGFAEILKNKSLIDQNCETVATEDGPDSPFELLNLNPSGATVSKGGQTTVFQTTSDRNTHTGHHIQTNVKDQSAFETVEDPEVSFLNNGLLAFALADNLAEGLSAKSAYAKLKENGLNDSGSNKLSLLSTELDSFELVQFDEPESKILTQGTAPPAYQAPNNPVDSQKRRNKEVSIETEAEDFEPMPVSEKLAENLDKSHTFPSRMTYCNRCFQGCTMRSVVLREQDYKSLFSGVCQSCLLRRLPDRTFKLNHYNKAYSALVLKYSKATDTWTGCETSVFVGEVLNVTVKGAQRQAFRVQYLHQEQLLGSYVGKEYLREKKAHAHLLDVERQMTAQYYVMEFNKRLYESNITTQIFYIPSEILLILEANIIVACVSVEPYMLGDFVKLTNNTTKINKQYSTTEYGIAFGHFTYEFSNREEIVVDLQGWVTANGKGLAYLTDPQIHSLRKPKSPSNFHQNGIMKFLQEQHGECCSPICQTALHNLTQQTQSGRLTS